ncbi:PilT/PilU family type 4a pilus ATPase [Patescibacteria group bacterium]|nr:PilT/PilU family type 4a pilus ATPase [Patescibacteria group bacterium]
MKTFSLPTVVDEAVRRKAADILLVSGCRPALKVEAKLVQLDQFAVLDDGDIKTVVEAILPKSKSKDLEENRQVDLAYERGKDRFRVNIFYQRGHLSVVMRYVQATVPDIDSLGLPGITKDLLENDNGLILMVGPTGSGKSTSLASMLQYINRTFEKHIITIEDPVEYVYENDKSIIQQRELGTDANSFPDALRAALREAPDIIMLGEMRDLESVAAAITVAETGHLVLSTVHANNAAGTIDRIIDIFPAGYKEQVRIQLADILLAVFNQRLVPKVDGSGLQMICEVMLANSAVRNAIRTNNAAQLPNIIQTSAQEGMYLLDDLLVKAARLGQISKDTALAFANDRVEVRKGLSAN